MSTPIASSSAVGPPPGMAVRLSSNEAPFGPSPAVVEAIERTAADVHRYPDDQSIALREALAERLGTTRDAVAVGTGSAALLMDAITHECRDGGDLLTFERAFIVYRLGARNAGAGYVEVPTGGPATPDRDGYARDVGPLLDRIDDDTRMVVIDNPGNPTGAHLTGDELRTLIAGVPDHVTVVIDEAYNEFAVGQRGFQTVRELGVEHPRLLVLRTFSKAYALAGLRVGYVTGPADLVTSVDAWRTRFNVNAVAQAAALAALGDEAHLERTVTGTLEGRARMAEGLRELGIPFTGGLGNFLTFELGTAAGPVVDAYASHGVGVRPLAPYGMTEQIRATVGTPDEVSAFLEASAEVVGDVPSRRR
jgi:histidinol-phosphate aminotransferase